MGLAQSIGDPSPEVRMSPVCVVGHRRFTHFVVVCSSCLTCLSPAHGRLPSITNTMYSSSRRAPFMGKCFAFTSFTFACSIHSLCSFSMHLEVPNTGP